MDLIRANFGPRVEVRGRLEANASVISTEKGRAAPRVMPRYD